MYNHIKKIFGFQTKELKRLIKRFNEVQRCLVSGRERSLVDVREPLVLISQIQRCGGSLLSQLFDGHPELHAHPHELYIGHPDKSSWPIIDLQADPQTWLDTLFEEPINWHFSDGYSKYSSHHEDNIQIFPFLLVPEVLRTIFFNAIARYGVKTQRDILNCYMTAYFNAWLDNQNLYNAGSTAKKYITSFVPRMHMNQNNLIRFFDTYSDGFLISIVRDPRNWFASAKKHLWRDSWGDFDSSVEQGAKLWNASTEASLRARRQFPASVYLLLFEDLVLDTPAAMKDLSAYLTIEYSDVLTQPTFNKWPIKANSSFPVDQYGIVKHSLQRYKTVLDVREIEYLKENSMPLYDMVKEVIGKG